MLSTKLIQAINSRCNLIVKRGIHKSTVRLDNPGYRVIAGSNTAPRYKYRNKETLYDELEPEYMRNHNSRHKLLMVFFFLAYYNIYWNNGLELLLARSEMDLTEFLTEEKKKLNEN